MDRSNIQFLYIVMELLIEVTMVKIISQLPNLCETDKFGHDPASRLATCIQVIEIHKSY